MAHLLVVDDEPRICRFVSRALEGHGHTVETARTGEAALAAVAGRDFALVVLDLVLPGIDGYAVLEQLLSQDSRARVLVLSAVGDVESRVQCLRMGAVDYLPKPFAVAELLARVDARLAERQPRAPLRWLNVGAARLDLQKRVLHEGKRSATLTQREFVLLGHLMRRAGEVCTRDELLADVWGFCFDPGSNVVDVYVGRLRGKLERQYIETVRNVGYCFSA
ncbi:MAG: DNA-binding heavy metal response regulator [Frankiales bacterium]|nr:DNA-binding heavy metal response regulator [Frankiales bacterium]